MEIRQQLKHYQSRVDNHLENCLPSESIDPLLQESMRYSLFNGGKRVRPALVYLVNQILGGTDEAADNAAAAIECIHSYSLVHDDLPAMDDDDLRRGKPTCHIAYDEATAILAGDALQCLAFELLANDQQQSADSKIKLIQLLSQASGHAGMVVGQSFDLRHVGKPLTLEQLEAMHQHKTGALLLCAVHMGATCSPRVSKEQLDALTQYAIAIGLAFQVQDDILDIEGDTAVLGKQQGADEALNKPTYPALLGLEGARKKAADLVEEAVTSLSGLPGDTSTLEALARYIITRDH